MSAHGIPKEDPFKTFRITHVIPEAIAELEKNILERNLKVEIVVAAEFKRCTIVRGKNVETITSGRYVYLRARKENAADLAEAKTRNARLYRKHLRLHFASAGIAYIGEEYASEKLR